MARPFKHPKTHISYFRQHVPTDLRRLMGNKIVSWSLRTKDPDQAKLLNAEAGDGLGAPPKATSAEKQEMIVKLSANCAAAGVPEKSPQYVACMQTEINAENAKRARQTIGMTTFGNGMAAAGDSYSAAARANRPVRCTTNRAVGWGSSTTTCY